MRLYAHRGMPGPASVHGPVENTLPAIAAGLAAGADGVEVDLRLSRDGVLVVSHDATLRRVAGSPLAVAATSWQVLRETCEGRGVPLTRAEAVLRAVGGRPVVLEVKQPPPGWVQATAHVLVTMIAALQAEGEACDVTVSSFSLSCVRAVRDAAPAGLGLRTALLGTGADRPVGLLRRALDAGLDEVHPQVWSLLTEPAVVGTAHDLGVSVVPWTVNRGRALRRCAGLGVDGLITDVPATARRVLAAVPAAA